MKRILRSFSISFFALALAACVEKELAGPDVREFAYTFKVNSEDTKTVFGTDHVSWQDGDQVASFALTSKNQPAAVSVGSDVTVKIKSTVALSAGDVVYAYYPYSNKNDASSASAVKLEIPSAQVSGSADAMPMVALPFTLTGAVSPDSETEVGTLRFLDLGSVIKMTIFSSNSAYQGESIQSITFNAGASCAGEFTFDLTAANASNAAISGYEATQVTVSAASPVTVGTSAADGGVLYMVVAPGTYSGSFTVSTDKGEYTYTSGKDRTYARAGLKPLEFDLGSANWTAVYGGYDTSIDSPDEFKAFLEGTSAEDTASYTITADLDMSGISITSASGFGGSLDGGGHSISNLVSSVPLFAQNSGSISNLVIAADCAFSAGSNIFGALVAEDKGGTYSSVKNKAAVTYTASGNISTQLMIGGIIGKADGATLTSCSNSNTVIIKASSYSHKAVGLGGLVGYAESTTFDSCNNRGPVTLNAKYGDPNNSLNGRSNAGINLGGILGWGYDVGKDLYCTFKSCQNETAGVITLNHTRIDGLSATSTSAYVGVGGVVGRARGNMKNCKNFAPINVTAVTSDRSSIKLQNYCVNVGGIAGVARWGISLDGCRNDGNITVAYDGKFNGNRNRGTIGGICGWQDYDGTDATTNEADIFAYYCKMNGSIHAEGAGVLSVGGIFGFSGKQIGNQVASSCTISYRGPQGFVGGLVGAVQDNPTYYTIKSCSCAATIVAEDDDADDKYFNVGGLIGLWGRNKASETWSCLTERDGTPCSFNGSVTSSSVSRVGILVGNIDNSNSSTTLNFGSSDNPIQVSGTYGRKDLASVTIDSGNVGIYAIGANEGATVNVYVTSSGSSLMSFNICSGRSNWNARRSGIVEMIQDQNPDIIGLQEVDDAPWEYLKSNLPAYQAYRPSSKTNAILYKSTVFELSGSGFFYLGNNYNTSGSANSWDDYERTVLYATIRHKESGKYYFFANTHFPLNQAGQTGSAALVESRIAALNTNNYPVILMGDFNCVIGNSCWDSIKAKMDNTRYSAIHVLSAENQNLYTYNAFGDSSKDRNKVDHIWVSKSVTATSYLTLTQEIKKYGDQEYLSDHYPIIAVIA